MSVTYEDLGIESQKFIPRPNFPIIKPDQDDESPGYGQLITVFRQKNEQTESWENIVGELKKKTIDVVILRRRYIFSYYDGVNNLMMGSTNEIDDWDQDVFVMNGVGHLVKSGHYKTVIKPFLQENFPKGDGHMFRLLTVLYVLYKGEVYRLQLSSSSVSGVKDSFKDPDTEGSLDWYLKLLRKKGVPPINFITSITVVEKKKKIGTKNLKFLCFEFGGGTENKNAAEALAAYKALSAQLLEYEKWKFFDRAVEAVEAPVGTTEESFGHGETVDLESLPDSPDYIEKDGMIHSSPEVAKPKQAAGQESTGSETDWNNDL